MIKYAHPSRVNKMHIASLGFETLVLSASTAGLVAFQCRLFLDRGLDDYDPLQLREPPLLRLQWPVLAHPAEIGPNRPWRHRARIEHAMM